MNKNSTIYKNLSKKCEKIAKNRKKTSKNLKNRQKSTMAFWPGFWTPRTTEIDPFRSGLHGKIGVPRPNDRILREAGPDPKI